MGASLQVLRDSCSIKSSPTGGEGASRTGVRRGLYVGLSLGVFASCGINKYLCYSYKSSKSVYS